MGTHYEATNKFLNTVYNRNKKFIALTSQEQQIRLGLNEEEREHTHGQKLINIKDFQGRKERKSSNNQTKDGKLKGMRKDEKN